jgi:formate dehydrogenase alpha subunit
VAGLVASFGSGAMTNSIPEFEDADCILITGSNTSEAHPLIASRIMRAKTKGAKIIVFDPRTTQMSMLADLHLKQQSGTDVVWLNGVMNVIIAEGLADVAFIAERTEGFDELKKTVAEYTPEYVEKVAGIPAENLIRAARIYGEAESASIVYAMGITQHITGVDNVVSCANLAMLTGNVGRPSTGVNPLRGQNNVQGACDLGGLPNVYPGYQSVTDPAIREKFERAWGIGTGLQSSVSRLSDEVGLTVTEMVELAGTGEVKAMYVMGENPLVADPDINHARACMEKLDFLVVQDIFLSETAEIADVVLPGSSYAEKEGTFTATDRRVQRVNQAIDPIGDNKPDWMIICELGKQMDAPGFDFASPAEIMTEIARLTPIYGGISIQRLTNGTVLQWPCPTEDHPGTPYLHKDKFSRGLGKFHAITYKEPAEMTDEAYPLILTTGRIMFHFHTGTMSRRAYKLHQEVPEAYIELHPDDASHLGLGRDQRVRVSSRRGEIELVARVTDRIKPGLVFIPFHFAEAAANALTNSAFDPVAKIPEYKVCAVKVEAV